MEDVDPVERPLLAVEAHPPSGATPTHSSAHRTTRLGRNNPDDPTSTRHPKAPDNPGYVPERVSCLPAQRRFDRCQSGATRVRMCRRRCGAARPGRAPAAAADCSARAAARISWPAMVRLRRIAASGIQPKWLICHNSWSSACSSGGLGLGRARPGPDRSGESIIVAREAHRRVSPSAGLDSTHTWRFAAPDRTPAGASSQRGVPSNTTIARL